MRYELGGCSGERNPYVHAILTADIHLEDFRKIMQAIPLGLIRVPSPGTPVQITTDTNLQVMQLVVRTVPGFTGRTYLGLANMDKGSSTRSGVIRILSEPPAFGPQDGEVLPAATGGHGNVIRVSDYWVDADVANEGVLVTCYVA